MRDPARIPEMLALLGALWKRFPDQRLGQLVYNAARIQHPAIEDVFDIEDNCLKEGIARLLGEDARELRLAEPVQEDGPPAGCSRPAAEVQKQDTR